MAEVKDGATVGTEAEEKVDLSKMDDSELDSGIEEIPNSKDSKREKDSAEENTDSDKGADDESDTTNTELEKAKKQVEDKKAFLEKRKQELQVAKEEALRLEREIGRTSNELHQTKSRESDAEVNGIIEDLESSDEDSEIDAKVEKALAKKQKEILQQQYLIKQRQEKVKSYMKEKIPNVEELFDDMAMIAKEGGAYEDAVTYFKTNPWVEEPGTLFGLAKAAQLSRENKALREENEKLKGGSKNVLKKVAQAASSGGKINSRVGQSSSKGGSGAALSEISDSELDEEIRSGDEEAWIR